MRSRPRRADFSQEGYHLAAAMATTTDAGLATDALCRIDTDRVGETDTM